MTERSASSVPGAVGGLVQDLPTDRLSEEVQDLLKAFGERALHRVGDRLSGATARLTDYAEGGGAGLASLLGGGGMLRGGASAARSLVGAGFNKAKDKVKSAVGGGGEDGGEAKGKKIKATNIVESIDIGLPVTDVYNQWTQFEDFPTFMKKVEDVRPESETEMNWRAQIFLSHRSWKSTVVEQMPDERIVWTSKGEKGHVDGAVTFHEMTPDLTRILLVLQYFPQGLFERTGNIWRAQGRRARLELKHFRRHAMTETILHQDEVRGWRGEVLDGEVVRSDEEVREEEEREHGEPKEEEPEQEEEADEEPEREEEADEEPEREEETDEEPEQEEETDEEPEEEEEPGEGEAGAEEPEDEHEQDQAEDEHESGDGQRPPRSRRSSTTGAR